ncbi:MAG: hypothetical protein LBS22_02630 [Puniceicoccales bacterium]|nr:hypothetical protein [Puniceicoccales bacterium]
MAMIFGIEAACLRIRTGILPAIFPDCTVADAFLLPWGGFLLAMAKWNMKLS